MTKTQYLDAIDKLGLSQIGAGRLLGLSRRQAQRLAAGDCPIPESAAKLLRLIIKRNIKPEEVT